MKNFLPVRCIGLILPGGSVRTHSSWTFVVATSTLKPASKSCLSSIGAVVAAAAPFVTEMATANADSTLRNFAERDVKKRFMGLDLIVVASVDRIAVGGWLGKHTA